MSRRISARLVASAVSPPLRPGAPCRGLTGPLPPARRPGPRPRRSAATAAASARRCRRSARAGSRSPSSTHHSQARRSLTASPAPVSGRRGGDQLLDRRPAASSASSSAASGGPACTASHSARSSAPRASSAGVGVGGLGEGVVELVQGAPEGLGVAGGEQGEVAGDQLGAVHLRPPGGGGERRRGGAWLGVRSLHGVLPRWWRGRGSLSQDYIPCQAACSGTPAESAGAPPARTPLSAAARDVASRRPPAAEAAARADAYFGVTGCRTQSGEPVLLSDNHLGHAWSGRLTRSTPSHGPLRPPPP